MLRSSMSLPSLPDRQPMDHSDGTSNSSPDTYSEIRSRNDSREESQQPPPQPRKPIPRKGHTKSRRGCYNCKRRRIKCNERHPECNHCMKAGLRCEYSENIIQTTQQSQLSPNPQEMINLRSTPGVFTMADMRLFHHFLITAYPHLPVGADNIWITVIPSFAHNYEYLIHSILALAASHLDAVSSANVAEEAISHRILAVKALNEALSVPPKTRNERDARMAAALALAFQSSHLQDGLLEFLTMAFREDEHLATMRTRMCASQKTLVDRGDLDLAALSIHDIELLNMTDGEKMFWNALIRTVENAYDRPIQAYTTFVQLYNIPSRWTYDEFQSFIDPNNSIAQILLGHFIALQAVLTPILMLERIGFQGIDAPTSVPGWVDGIYKNVPLELRHYMEWPRQVTRYPMMRLYGQKHLDYYERAWKDSEGLT
ncbi:hypothetical protein PMIN07_000526 [Paraphaeosphaeria minitans]